jgi:hypothetical protein
MSLDSAAYVRFSYFSLPMYLTLDASMPCRRRASRRISLFFFLLPEASSELAKLLLKVKSIAGVLFLPSANTAVTMALV